MNRTLSEDIQWIINLNVHLIADRIELVTLRGHGPPVACFDFVRRTAVPTEGTLYDNARSVDIRLKCPFAAVLNFDCYLSSASHKIFN
jgi:hypothetical protein